MDVINNQQQDNLNDYKIKIWYVPLDIDKQMLELHLKNLGSIKSLKFNVKNLYYEVVVRFNGKQVESTIKNQWSLRFCKYTFRIFPSNLTKEERNLCFKYGLKLANLSNCTYAADLKNIMAQVNAKLCFVPKNRFSRNYEKERFTFIFFDNQNSYNNALVKASKPSVSFRPLFTRNQHYENQEGMYNWDSANEECLLYKSIKEKDKQKYQEPIKNSWNQQNINKPYVNINSRTFSSIVEEDSEAMKITETEQFTYKPSMSLNESPLSPKP
ncbi:hypothetical protein C1646_768660 [Rhizophagus diaphanus]|nr:hypothetical protein C1646_768660 [Rhizophagus diaphanus] [Rhizophagus sp. MUCL 43196]